MESLSPEIFLPILLTGMALGLLFSLVLYILQAVGVYTMAKRMNFAHPGLAFVPVMRWYTFGKLAEADIPAGGRKTVKTSLHLPVLATLNGLTSAAMGVVMGWIAAAGESAETMMAMLLGENATTQFVGLWSLMSGLSVANSVVNIIFLIFSIYATYRVLKLFGSTSPALLTVLCALIDFLRPILLFTVRRGPITMSTPPQSPDNHGGNDQSGDDGFYYDR